MTAVTALLGPDYAACHTAVMSAPDAMRVFDRATVRRHRDRAAPLVATDDFLFAELAERVADRLGGINRKFACALDLGCRAGGLTQLLTERLGIATVVAADLSPRMAAACARARGGAAMVLAADEEFLPMGAARFDLVVSALALHWVNDLPGALIQIRHALKPDGLFLGAMLGGETLGELRQSLLEAETEMEGGASPRTSPLADLRDAAGLLQRAGFALPVADAETINATYAEPIALMRDLRAIGETNATVERRKSFTRRATLLAAAERYGQRFGLPDGRVKATFQALFLTGWAPAATQQKPLAPGSAKARLADALGATELPAGDKTAP